MDEAREMTVQAFELSELLELPVILRTTTRINHANGMVTLGPLRKRTVQGQFDKKPMDYVYIPAVSRRLHPRLLDKIERAVTLSDQSPLNRIEGSGKWGIVCNRLSYGYVSDTISELGMTPPVPIPVDTLPEVPARPPNLCPGCPHRATYAAVREVFGDEAIYPTDIGCYTLGLLPPLHMGDFLIAMGAGISTAGGFSRATGRKVVAFVGDSTFFHSGLSPLASAVYNNHDFLVVVLALQAGSAQAANMVMLGALAGSRVLPIDLKTFREMIRTRTKPQFAEINLIAFDLGTFAVNFSSTE